MTARMMLANPIPLMPVPRFSRDEGSAARLAIAGTTADQRSGKPKRQGKTTRVAHFGCGFFRKLV